MNGYVDENELTQEERERVIELMLSQDRVISLLYDREPAANNVQLQDPTELPIDEEEQNYDEEINNIQNMTEEEFEAF